MSKYTVRLKAQVNCVKDIKIEALDEKIAYRLAQSMASDMLDNCIKVVKKKDKEIMNNMSYFNTTKPKKI